MGSFPYVRIQQCWRQGMRALWWDASQKSSELERVLCGIRKPKRRYPWKYLANTMRMDEMRRTVRDHSLIFTDGFTGEHTNGLIWKVERVLQAGPAAGGIKLNECPSCCGQQTHKRQSLYSTRRRQVYNFLFKPSPKAARQLQRLSRVSLFRPQAPCLPVRLS